jgi:hypothetical protein
MAAGNLITADGQLEWRDTLLGSASPYRMVRLEGWLDMAEVRVRDQERPGRHGLFQGTMLLGKRVITLTYLIKGVPQEEFGAVVDRLRAITAPGEQTVEEPLIVRLDGQVWLTNARCVRRTVDVGRYYATGHTTGAIQWHATDPRLYSVAEQETATGLPTRPTDGLPFPLVFPLTFGATGRGGELFATNTGSMPAWPVWEITGPVVGPAITNLDTGQRLVFDPAFTIQTGQKLVVDTDARTVLLNDVNRNDRLLTRDWFPVPAGGSVRVGFTASSYDATARLTARWRHATI